MVSKKLVNYTSANWFRAYNSHLGAFYEASSNNNILAFLNIMRDNLTQSMIILWRSSTPFPCCTFVRYSYHSQCNRVHWLDSHSHRVVLLLLFLYPFLRNSFLIQFFSKQPIARITIIIMLNNYTFSSTPLYYQRQDVHLRLRNSGSSRKYHPNPHLTVVDACLFSTRRQVLKLQVIVAISVQFIFVRSSLLKEIRGIHGETSWLLHATTMWNVATLAEIT